jgi:predicted extracellular nuclease
MMRNFLYLLTLLFWFSSFSQPSIKSYRNEFTIACYNVENLFDTIDNIDVKDEEFLPSSEKLWTSIRYQKKLDDISRVLLEINPSDLPVIIGLVEVENQNVLNDLVHASAFKNQNYGIIHHESPDFRGIDVAMIYRKDKFKVIMHEILPVTFDDDPNYKTRDILLVTGQLNGQIFHIFVNHWPSRIGGDEKTETKRMKASAVLKNRINQLFAIDPKANIIVMGDMNDEPTNKSLTEIQSVNSIDSGARLVNIMVSDDSEGLGTYFYNGDWNMLDNILVSNRMINSSQFRIENNKGSIFSSEWMIFENKNGAKTPNRTYVGNKYTGGVSDHFPVYFKIKVK